MAGKLMKIPWKFLFGSALLALLFVACPSLDLRSSAFFYRGGAFFLAGNPLVRLVYRGVPVLATLYVLFLIGALLLLSFARRTTLWGLGKKGYLYLLLAFALGPGLVVNVVLKDHVGRARPSQVVQFGGSKKFTPAFVLSDQVKHNGSFVCGHAAVGFSLVALALLLERRRRRLVFAGAVLGGGLIGLVRMVQGGHFLSDVIFSFVFVYLVSYLLHAYMFRRERLPLEVA